MIASKLKLFCLLAVLLLWVNKVLLADTVSVSVKDYQLELRDFDAKKMDAYKADRNYTARTNTLGKILALVNEQIR